MAVDRNTLYKKFESNSCIVKKLHIRCVTVWKVVKSSRKLVKHATDQAMAEMNSPNEVSGEKYEGKVEKEFMLFCWKNGGRGRNQSNFNALNPQRRPQNLSLQNAEKAWTFNHSWTYKTWEMSIHSESHERRNGAQFGVHWWEEIWCLAMPKPPKW